MNDMHELNETESSSFHKLYGAKQTRITYQKKDFLDYTLMSIFTGLIIYFSYGSESLMAKIGIFLCLLLNISFVIRHGFEFSLPAIFKRPQDVLYMFIYKIQNIKLEYYFALGFLVLENYLISLTANLPHKVELTHKIALYLFFIHFTLITIYRTVILIAHLHKKEHVREVLMDTAWKAHLIRQPSIILEIFHAYFTGILTHILLIAPWFIIISYFNFSIIFLPVACALNIFIFRKALEHFSVWYYRDHWLGHNSEIEFLYLHGSHHDAIPSGLIGVSGNGHIEGFLRHTIGGPIQFFNPLITFLLYTTDIQRDIALHQYIPGVYRKTTREFHGVHQHSIHHFGKLKPYGFGLNLNQPNIPEEIVKQFKIIPDSLKNSAKLDEQLNGFEWDNPKHKWFLELFDKYQK
jgi:hypothetical protein